MKRVGRKGRSIGAHGRFREQHRFWCETVKETPMIYESLDIRIISSII